MRITRRSRGGAVVVILGLLAGACGGSGGESAAFCEKLAQVTGPDGVESVLVPGDPSRIDGVVDELEELHDRAPEEISATTRTLVNFFGEYQRAPRAERREVIADNERVLAQASVALNQYALTECGLLLDRIPPTPIPTANPSIEAPNE